MNHSTPRTLHDTAIGIPATGMRRETDSMGEIEVPADRYWGAQTQRSLVHFSIGDDRMAKRVYHAYGYVKKAAALINAAAGRLAQWKADAIVHAADEAIKGVLDEHFPLYVWQTGSGTQSNMNVNEVLSNRAIQLLGGKIGSKEPVHPNDDVNMGQSSNDTFPTAMHIAAVVELEEHLLPHAEALAAAIEAKANEWMEVVKTGRTHLMDAVPLTVGQEWSGWGHQLRNALDRLSASEAGLFELAAGGTAVGTGLNAPPDFGREIAEKIADLTGYPFVTAPNKFAAQGSLDAVVAAMGAVRGLAVALMKIANDMRWLASGPRCGLGELLLPENEPGSSIMPGKVNPTQAEALTMVCCQIFGNQTVITTAASQGHLELNVFKPVVAHALLQSIRLMSDAASSFTSHCVAGIRPNVARISELVEKSLMLVTALAPSIGYDKAAAIAKAAHANGTTLRQEAIRLGHVSAEEFDRLVRPDAMTHPS